MHVTRTMRNISVGIVQYPQLNVNERASLSKQK